ncbi:MICAL-like protein 2a isoform X2 [Hippoglossus hippoglossus]|uniref:MICAL-like protein 2a isoform X2 n=1 Tax=Hippoglossus hippoglossus TaxID=8267 RepID=UPI00148D5A82|nr:MICAL-like protein 2a isoform X2 [Hippoglossus hippoglossus]
MAAIKALEQWCRLQCDGYRDVAVTNMTTSFRSGLAFCALIHKYRPDLINYDSLRKEDVFENNRLAFQVAEEKLGIPALLDAEDMVALRVPDRLSILTYVSQYYNYFKGRAAMGGVKRPAEGSKEEPSEKKNLPVVAKTFVSKTTAENRSPSTRTAQTSPKLPRAAAQKVVLAENANKSGTLNSKCVACKNHVHLVQRHFVEGKLFHRSCFKCSECSGTLHAGGYKLGKTPDTFICSTNHKSCKPPSSEVASKNVLATSAVRSNGASQTQNALRPSSVLSAPLSIIKKQVSATPPPHSWTSSAQRTQVARQRFFETASPVTQASADNRKPTEPSGVLERPKVTLSPTDEKSRARNTTGWKVAEENCNNNNKRAFTVRSAERRFGDGPSSADSPGLRKENCSQGPAGNWAGQRSTSQADNKESPRLKAVDKDDTRPTTVHATAKDPVCREGQSEFNPVRTKLVLKDAEAEQHEPGFMSSPSSNVIPTRPPTSPAPAPPPVCFALSDPVNLVDVSPQKSQPDSENPGVKHFTGDSPVKSPPGRPAVESTSFSTTTTPGFKRSPVKSPPRRPAVESISISTTSSANHGRPSGAKKGKYLSPTNASRTEMRSPSVKSCHVPVEQIERELSDIETNLAQLEKEGVELEKELRSCEEEGEGDILMDPLMVDWFNLIRKKQMYIRKESEIVYTARTQELEQQQPGVEGELRRLLETPDHLKSREERQRETTLMQMLMEIVNGRNAIVEGLDEDRLREVEEDQQLNEMMKNLGVKKTKNKRKSSISKLFRRRSKRRVQ